MNAIALFAGAGGLSEGFKRANFNILAANEIDEQIAKTYKSRHNLNKGELFCKDIKDLSVGEIYSAIGEKKIDVIIGGPPCQGFSMAGSRIRENALLEDPRNYLFREYYRIIDSLSPDFFVMENVPGLKSFKDGMIVREIKRIFNESGYYIDIEVLNSANYGVPQARNRLFILGSKNIKINLREKANDYKKSKVTVKNAISDLNFLEAGEGNKKQDYRIKPESSYQYNRRKKSNKLYNHKATNHSTKTIKKMKQVKPGENWRKLNNNGYDINSNHSGAYGRLEWDKPAVTITTRFDTPPGGRFIHPERHRTLTPREAARIQSFDDDYIFIGNKSSVKKQIGNAVPPLMAEVIAKIIKSAES